MPNLELGVDQSMHQCPICGAEYFDTADYPYCGGFDFCTQVGKNRIELGQLVRDVWVKWAKDQLNPKPSWLIPWEELDQGQRQVDCEIGEAIARVVVNHQNKLRSFKET